MRENPSEIVKTRDRRGGQKDRSEKDRSEKEKNRKRIRERERERDRQRQRESDSQENKEIETAFHHDNSTNTVLCNRGGKWIQRSAIDPAVTILTNGPIETPTHSFLFFLCFPPFLELPSLISH